MGQHTHRLFNDGDAWIMESWWMNRVNLYIKLYDISSFVMECLLKFVSRHSSNRDGLGDTYVEFMVHVTKGTSQTF